MFVYKIALQVIHTLYATEPFGHMFLGLPMSFFGVFHKSAEFDTDRKEFGVRNTSLNLGLWDL